jgi:hypothetical protein
MVNFTAVVHISNGKIIQNRVFNMFFSKFFALNGIKTDKIKSTIYYSLFFCLHVNHLSYKSYAHKNFQSKIFNSHKNLKILKAFVTNF